MRAGKNPSWLQEIRAYWKEVSRQEREERAEEPPALSGEAALPFSAGKEVPGRQPQPRKQTSR